MPPTDLSCWVEGAPHCVTSGVDFSIIQSRAESTRAFSQMAVFASIPVRGRRRSGLLSTQHSWT